MSIYNQGFGGGMNPSITVTTTAGATVTVTLGTKSVTATATGGTAKISVWDYGSYGVHSVLGDATGDTTVNVIAVQDYAVTVELVEPIPRVLNNATWAQIKEVAEKSQGPNYWSVGDTKEITINGKLSDGLTMSNYSTWVYIIGFDHNSSVEGTGIAFQGFKTAQTGGIDIALVDSGIDSAKTSGQWFNMNNASTISTGGWKDSLMRTVTIPTVKSAFPNDLVSVIKKTNIYSDNTGGASEAASYVTATQDDLYLLAEYEAFGARTYANTAEQNYQQQYAYYSSGNSRIKYRHNSTATDVVWWERSVRAAYSGYFCSVGSAGGPFIGQASTDRGLAPAFKVGGAVTKPISSLAVGTSVYIKEKETDVSAEYIIVQQGNPDATMYDASCDGTWVLRKDCYYAGQWDGNKLNSYKDSGVYTWLNGYFYSRIDANIKEYIKEVKIPYVNGTGSSAISSGANGLTSKAFLLSGKELGFVHSSIPEDGALLSYFESGDTSSAKNKRIAYYVGSAYTWWTRSPQTTNTDSVWFTNESGGNSVYYSNNTYGYRPCFILSEDALVDEFNNVYPSQSSTIPASYLTTGSTVKLTEGGVAAEYLVVQQGLPGSLYDSSCNGTWLLRKDCPVLRPFNSNAVGNYVDGNVRQYLENDFYNSLGDETKAAIINAKIPYVAADGTFYSGANGLSSNVFIASISETGIYPNNKTDGSTLFYFYYIGGNVVSDKRVCNWNDQPVQWWTRTRKYDNTTDAYLIETTGVLGSNSADGWKAVRPCVIINSNTLFNKDTLTLN